jgi:predicted dehydrogenase
MRVGIIGASFAKAAYLPALKHVPGAEVVAIASAREESAAAAAKAFGVPHAYGDWTRMLAEHRFDLVCIATPTDTHAPMTLAALDAGAHVLCEKPTAMNAGEAKAMLDRAQSLGRVHMIDHELRFNPNRRKIAALIAEGAIGQVRHVSIYTVTNAFGDPRTRPIGDWLSSVSQGGGRLGANGSHNVDLLRWWLGEVAAVSGELRTLVPQRFDKTTGAPFAADADDFTSFRLEMRSGAVAEIVISAAARHGVENAIHIFGSEGTITLSATTETLQIAKAGGGYEDITLTDANATLEGVGPGVWNVSVVAAMRELASAIMDQRPLREGATFLDGWRNQIVLDCVRRSSAERRWVDVPA